MAADAASFAIDQDVDDDTHSRDGTAMGFQLMTKAALNHEAKSSYTVTVTANDHTSSNANATARITVTIMVINVDEGPTIMAGDTSVDPCRYPAQQPPRVCRERHKRSGDLYADWHQCGFGCVVLGGRRLWRLHHQRRSAQIQGVPPTTRRRPTPTVTTFTWSP